ncbi:Uncharacterised protein [Starkeya nomas]|uniref:CcmD family protein n=1 Tax=Starkeya nomas TaxID=2666134 RepID=A0A5S9PC37_9HYPH|nr:hypothetical protein [Starkeya nomas]CAA0101280.1 Uncharacterised protein [Starkeya nomas]
MNELAAWIFLGAIWIAIIALFVRQQRAHVAGMRELRQFRRREAHVATMRNLCRVGRVR